MPSTPQPLATDLREARSIASDALEREAYRLWPNGAGSDKERAEIREQRAGVAAWNPKPFSGAAHDAGLPSARKVAAIEQLITAFPQIYPLLAREPEILAALEAARFEQQKQYYEKEACGLLNRIRIAVGLKKAPPFYCSRSPADMKALAETVRQSSPDLPGSPVATFADLKSVVFDSPPRRRATS